MHFHDMKTERIAAICKFVGCGRRCVILIKRWLFSPYWFRIDKFGVIYNAYHESDLFCPLNYAINNPLALDLPRRMFMLLLFAIKLMTHLQYASHYFTST